MAKKSKKDRRRDERERAKEEERLAAEFAAARRRKFQIAAIVIPIVTLGVSFGIYFAFDDRQLGAIFALIGMAVWVPVLLGLVGGGITPRDRNRAGSIDFGNRG